MDSANRMSAKGFNYHQGPVCCDEIILFMLHSALVRVGMVVGDWLLSACTAAHCSEV